MTIEQRPELNRFVDPSIIEPWRNRWQRLKLFLPIWLYGLACLLELGLFGAWLTNKPLLECLAVSTGPLLTIFLLFIILGEFFVRSGHRSRRVIQFQADKIILGSGKFPCVAWKDVSKIQLEPIAESPSLTKLILTHFGPQKKRRQRSYMLVIENPAEVQELIACLRKQKTEAPSNYEIAVLDAPSPPPQVPDLFWSMSLFFAGLFLLYHGAPILLKLLGREHHEPNDDSRFTPEQQAKLAHFMAQHFANRAEFRHFFLTLSIGLTIAGVALIVLGGWLLKRKPQVKLAPGTA
jgi:hypothetical protein